MKKVPITILIVSILLIIVGGAGFISHLRDFINTQEKLYVTILVQLLRILAIISGVLLLQGINSGRWLAVAWVFSHILISAFNSASEVIAHIVIFIILSVLLFLPMSSKYFQSNNKT
jgi:Trk-type K+ transport system membrane component